MTVEKISLQEDYWQKFQLNSKDVEFLYNTLLETETPQTTRELLGALVNKRISEEITRLKKQHEGGKKAYLPKDRYKKGETLVFPAYQWQEGKVETIRPGNNPSVGEFEVIRVRFADGGEHEFASGIAEHRLNAPVEVVIDGRGLNADSVLRDYQDVLSTALEEELNTNADFVQIAGTWFPRSLLIDINVGHLNIAEAMLDLAGGGPMLTDDLLQHIDLDAGVSTKLREFSLNFALQEDVRFDEVGPSGQTLWFLHRLEPADVLQPPKTLRAHTENYDRSTLTEAMLALESELDDELTPETDRPASGAENEPATLRLIYPHWVSGTLPLTSRLQAVFPTAYEAPRVRFTFVDGETKEKFPAWVVRKEKYVTGLAEWYQSRGLIPGSIIQLQKGKLPGEIILQTGNQRSSRDYLRTVLVGTDGGIVFAMLRQVVKAEYDERMGFFIPNPEGLAQAWVSRPHGSVNLESIVLDMMRNIARLTPQGHVHASELYAAVNLIYRCPPGPILAILASGGHFVHVGDLHFHLKD